MVEKFIVWILIWMTSEICLDNNFKEDKMFFMPVLSIQPHPHPQIEVNI